MPPFAKGDIHRVRRKAVGRAGFTLLEVMIVVVMVGILSAVAIPAYLKYSRMAKSTEAGLGIRAIGDGAVAYFSKHHHDKQGRPTPREFPGAGGKHTLPQPQLCASGTPTYKPDPSIWEIAPWKQLSFVPTKHHYFRYTFEASGQDVTAAFRIEANGNVDCDATTSSFVQYGAVDPKSGSVYRSGIQVTNKDE